mgnify:CR=1 FL=1
MAEEIQKIKVSELPLVGNITDFDVLGVDRVSNKSVKASMQQLIKPALDAASAANDATLKVNEALKLLTDVPDVFGYRYPAGQADDRVEIVNDLPYDDSGVAPAGSKRARLLNKIRPYQCNHDGSQREYLQDDVRLKVGYSPSNLTTPLKLQMARIPYLHYRSFRLDGYCYVLFCERAPEAMSEFTDVTAWKEVKSFGFPRYQGTVVDFDGVKKLCSFSGQNPTVSISLAASLQYARNVSPKACVLPYFLYEPIAFLMVLELGRHNAQIFYPGITDAGASYANAAKNGVTDTLTTPSGEVQVEYETGKFTKQFRWRFMEGIYGHVWKLLSGTYYRWEPGWEKIKVYITRNISDINASNDFSKYILAGETPKAEGWVKEFIPGTIISAELGGSSTTHKSDYNYTYVSAQNAFTYIAMVGGYSNDGGRGGPFYLNSSVGVGSARVHIGASLVITD